MQIINRIVTLNEERYGVDFHAGKAYVKLLEELQEFREAKNYGDEDKMLDSLADLVVIAVGEIRKMGFNPCIVLDEVLKEIESRKQDPRQALRWKLGEREAGEKWQKDKNQNDYYYRNL